MKNILAMLLSTYCDARVRPTGVPGSFRAPPPAASESRIVVTYLVRFTLLLALTVSIAACSRAPQANHLTRFVQDGTQSFAEITDGSGGAWKVLTAETGSLTTLFVYDSSDRIMIAAGAAPRPSGPARAIIVADPSGKQAALAVLDHKSLFSLSGRSGAFDSWLGKIAPFTDEQSIRLDVKPGAFGKGSATVNGNRIIVSQPSLYIPCHCSEDPSGCPNTADHECHNAVCDWVNCVFKNGVFSPSSCPGELSNAATTCEAARP